MNEKLRLRAQRTLYAIAASGVLTGGAVAAQQQQQQQAASTQSAIEQERTILHHLMLQLEELFTVDLLGILFVLAIFFFLIVSGFLVVYIIDVMLRRVRTARHWRTLVRYLLWAGIIVFALWVALAAIGVDFFSILFAFGVVSLLLSSGISGPVSNVLGGMAIQTTDHFERGHVVSVAGYTGQVLDTSFTSTTLLLRDGTRRVVLPNAIVSGSPVVVHNPDGATADVGFTRAMQTGAVPADGHESDSDALALDRRKAELWQPGGAKFE